MGVFGKSRKASDLVNLTCRIKFSHIEMLLSASSSEKQYVGYLIKS